MAGDLLIGMMSGTSVDGIDAALVRFESATQLQLIDTAFTPFPPALREAIVRMALSSGKLKADDYHDLDQELAQHYANAATRLMTQAGVTTNEVRALANHGQTVRHEPRAKQPYTLQLGDPQRIADLTGLTTLARFRQADIAEGGEGAPLMPAFHQALFAETNQSTAILNIGGIANLTLLGEPVLGFDTGPGNTLMDQWILQHQNQTFDRNGEWATQGQVNETLLNALLADDYFQRSVPKSTGTDLFNLAWLEAVLTDFDSLQPVDVQATLLALTVQSIAQELERLAERYPVEKLFVCGGGAFNGRLMQALRNRLPDVDIDTTEALGIAPDWVEAIGFAWLGFCHIQHIPSNLPSVTGARRAVVLGERFEPFTGI